MNDVFLTFSVTFGPFFCSPATNINTVITIKIRKLAAAITIRILGCAPQNRRKLVVVLGLPGGPEVDVSYRWSDLIGHFHFRLYYLPQWNLAW